MKSLRRSFNKDPPPISTPISTFPVALSKPAAFQQPPKKVIRCVRPYRSQRPQELSCSVGDFLYVAREIEGGWYEVSNPANNSRGIVPKACFEEVNKATPSSIAAGPNARLPPSTRTQSTMSTLRATKHQTFYAIVQYDFSAERPDELDAKAGEPISVVAQSNREWFVAKPIGRLGGPGLIPVSFVEIRDPLTNQPVKDIDGLMERGVLPRVEEWKQATAEYKASSIPLGVLDDAAVGEGVKNSPFMKNVQPSPGQGPTRFSQAPQHERTQSQAQSFATSHSHSQGHSHHTSEPEAPPPANAAAELLPAGKVLSATIPSFHYENDEYWFRIDATYQTAESTPRLLQLVLYRNYEDFYEFQISLLDAFPVEAGRARGDHASDNGYPTPPGSVEENSTRILPYMPGPVSYVDDMITSVRRTELDQYLGELCDLEAKGAGRVLRHELVQTFFSPKSGDVVEEMEGSAAPSHQWKAPSNPAAQRIPEEDEEEKYDQDDYGPPYQGPPGDLVNDMERLRLQQPGSNPAQNVRSSRGSDYGYGNDGSSGPSRAGYGNEYESPQDGSQYSAGDYPRRSESDGRRSRGSSPHKNPPYPRIETDRRPESASADSPMAISPATPYSGGAGASGFYPSDPHSNYSGHAHSYSYSSVTGGSTLSPPVTQAQHPYTQGGSKSARSSSGNPNDYGRTPQSEEPSSSGAQPAFLKIKIFHSESDDLIAIRVPPKVTYTQLINKVRDRLGAGVSVLRYRDSFDGGNKNWKEIEGDADLREWIGRGDKLVLYAD